MKSKKLTLAIRATTSALVLTMAGQAGAVSLFPKSPGDAAEYDVNIYGYASFKAAYDLDEDIAISTRSGAFSRINTGAAEDDEVTGHFGADAFQTRIGVMTTSPEGVKVVVEGDFRGGGGGVLRLRHGYGEYNGVLLGQTWSNFTSFVGNTSVLDFDGLAGNAGVQGRTPQARYTSGPLSFALEQPLTSANSFTQVTQQQVQNNVVVNVPTGAVAPAPVDLKDSLPVVTARFEESAGGLSYSAALMVQQIDVENGLADDSAVGFATFVAAKMALTDMITIQGAFNYTDGGNAYLYRSGENFAAEDAYVANGNVETIAGYGGTIGAGFNLGGGRSVNIGYGLVTVDWDDAEDDFGAQAPSIIGGKSETNQNAMINYQWSPVKNANLGVEYGYFKRENQNGNDGDAMRVMFAGQYNF